MQLTSTFTPYNSSKPIDKIKRYGWIESTKPGKLAWKKKSELSVDHLYQRQLSQPKCKRIAAEFNWAAFGVLVVVERPDGTLAVTDGQHRLAGAMLRSDIEVVPCVIFEGDGRLKSEASDFLTINKNRKPLTGLETFRAMVISNDPAAEKINQMIEDAGLELSNKKSPKAISCIKTISDRMKDDPEVMQRIWPLALKFTEGHGIEKKIIDAMHYAERFLTDDRGDDRSLLETENRKKLFEVGYDVVMKSIFSAAVYRGRSNGAALAEGLINALNHRRRNKLKLKD